MTTKDITELTEALADLLEAYLMADFMYNYADGEDYHRGRRTVSRYNNALKRLEYLAPLETYQSALILLQGHMRGDLELISLKEGLKALGDL